MMKLAHQLGIDVPDVDVIYTPEPAYIVERFDRIGDYPKQERKHIVDACQLLGYGRGSKYGASTVETYKKLLKEVRPPALTSLKLFQWVLFNLLTGNGDAHLKNISFFYVKGFAQLTPFYDLLSTIIYVPEGAVPLNEKVSVPINGKQRFGDVTREDVLVFAQTLGIPNGLASKHLHRIASSIDDEFSNLYQQVEQLPPCAARPGELRMLRQVQFLVVKEMVNRLL